jgi:TetR/AcrR family transcriptional repressor of nem operon
MQAVLQGAFILAKATGNAGVAVDSIAHLRCYVVLVFGASNRHPHRRQDRDDANCRE